MNEEQYAFSDTWHRLHPVLWKRLNQDVLSEAEGRTLAEWIAESEGNKQLYEELTDDATLYRELSRLHAAEMEKDDMRAKMLAGLPEAVIAKRVWFRWMHLAAAILILALVSSGLYFFFFRQQVSDVVQTSSPDKIVNDLPPGKDVAILRLADGSEIVLDQSKTGELALQGNAKVRQRNGELKYESSGRAASAVYNTVSTPRGGFFRVVLEDGSKVYLNAASSIRFPAAFSGAERSVEITGEAFFEVAARPRPFVVRVMQPSGEAALVQVLGTAFNINGYDNEPAIKTTLLEGVVKIGSRQSAVGNNPSVVLKPGQQAVLTHGSRLTIDDKVDVSQAVAWKDGYFFFSSSDITSVFRQLERWYDLDVVYEGAVPADRFSGRIQRNLPLSKVLKYLQKMEIQCRLDGKKLVVLQ